MSIGSIVRAFQAGRPKGQKLTRAEAMEICRLISSDDCAYSDGGYQFINYDAVRPLKKAFPEFNWRVTEDLRGEYKHCFVTILKNSKWEHHRSTDALCMKCNKFHQQEDERKAHLKGLKAKYKYLFTVDFYETHGTNTKKMTAAEIKLCIGSNSKCILCLEMAGDAPDRQLQDHDVVDMAGHPYFYTMFVGVDADAAR